VSLFESNLTRLNTSLDTEFYDTQAIIINQLIYELNSSKNEQITSNIVEVLKLIEFKLHQLIISYNQMKLMNELNELIISLNLIYDIIHQANESVNYNHTIEILTDIICSMTQSTFICQSIANLIEKFVIICPNILVQSQIKKKLFLSIAKQTSRDTFQNSISSYQRKISNVIQSISV